MKRKRRNAFDISGEKDTADAEVWKYYIKKKLSCPIKWVLWIKLDQNTLLH
jgi:hypothetical protein